MNLRIYKQILNPNTVNLLYRLGQHDEETLNHCLRVGIQMDKVVNIIPIPEGIKCDWVTAALLHDIGKLYIPAEVLNKPDKLDKLEKLIIVNHSLFGNDVIAAIEYSSVVQDGIAYHHERLDGKGYPYMMTDNQIPMVARMIAVLDAYDVMTHKRSYKEAYPKQVALRELTALIGEAFCEDCVTILQQAGV